MREAILLSVLAACGCTELSGERPKSVKAVGYAPVAKVADCPDDMVLLESFCIDRFEAYVVEVDSNGAEREHSPFDKVDNLKVRAKNASKHIPQGYISQVQASDACKEAGKRLCSKAEFLRACQGPEGKRTYPYGEQKKEGVCNEGKGSSAARMFGMNTAKWTYDNLNDPKLNQLSDTLVPSGSYVSCKSDEGVFDLVGNLHEWGDDPPDANGHGRFRGGFYGDAQLNLPGCFYETRAHEPTYHDYSTGFRCCKAASP